MTITTSDDALPDKNSISSPPLTVAFRLPFAYDDQWIRTLRRFGNA
ncbi:hypothetical protein AZE42_13990 [Rhizopogon vesiculosus]|uniref:Uncharacterized protein n=1 Tax=Rhizopogon vesiculosus TaxID=180088 RepID=A0A1J8QIY5_9AGAM|nr:hypothetical protein AZE42_13990 [Rhizopogon vesiculosus]